MNINTLGFGLMEGREGHLPFSHSKAEVAKTCMAKFARIYLSGERENSPALLLGSFAHETIENMLRDTEAPTLEKAQAYLQQIRDTYDGVGDKEVAYRDALPLLNYMVSFVSKWKTFLTEKQIKHWKIESAFGLQENLTRAQYEPGTYRTYLRGRVDLWAYDQKEKTLYIVDHKTNKSISSQKKVHENPQLNLYVGFITNTYKLDWEKCYFCLNYLRRGKAVWSMTTRDENKFFMQTYINTLHTLEDRILDCEMNGVFPEEESYMCGMCSFKDTCATAQMSNLNTLAAHREDIKTHPTASGII